MTKYASFDDLIPKAADGGPELRDVEISGGRVVQVRGLSRREHLWIGKGTEDPAEIERRILAGGMVQPRLSDAQLRAWQDVPAGSRDVARVSDVIRELSGFGEGAEKSDVREVRTEP